MLRLLRLFETMLRKEGEAATAEFRNHIRQVRLKAKPLRIELVPSAETSWLETAPAGLVVEFLLQSGFESAGVFTIKGSEKAVVAGFAAAQHGVFATVLKGTTQPYVSLVSDFTDGSSFECSNMAVPFEMPCPEWLVRKRYTGASPQDLWSRFLAERPSKPMQAATAGSFADWCADAYFRYQVWMAERGGATRDELETRYRALGKLPAGEEADRFLDFARSNEIEQAMCNWWRLQSEAPYPLEQVLESLVIVHDELPPDLLLNAYLCWTNDFKVQEADFVGRSPREAFARTVEKRGGLLRMVFQKRTPLQADFYLPAGDRRESHKQRQEPGPTG
jgi:hypothetical protein